MGSWLDFDRSKSSRSVDFSDIAEQLSAAASYLGQLTQNFGKRTNARLDRARDVLSDAALDAEENLRDHVVVSLVVAAGVGLVVGYLFGRGSNRDW